jgi:heptosyltransferase-2
MIPALGLAELRRILVVKLADIGDALLTTPALRAVRETFPDARIAMLVTPAARSVVERCRYIDELITFEKSRYDAPADALGPGQLADVLSLGLNLRRKRFDAVVLLHHLTTRWGAVKHAALVLAAAPIRAGLDNGRGWFLTHRAADPGFDARHEVQHYLAAVGAIGAQTDDFRLELDVNHADDLRAAALLGGDQGAMIAIHAGSGAYSLARRWPAAHFAAAANAIGRRADARFVLVGQPGDDSEQVEAHIEAPVLNLVGRTDIHTLGAVLRRCRLVLCNDGGVMHVAAAVGTPVVAVFGPSNATAWGPWSGHGDVHRVVRMGLPCSPCLYRGLELGSRQGCPARTCLAQLGPELVIQHALDILGQSRGTADG